MTSRRSNPGPHGGRRTSTGGQRSAPSRTATASRVGWLLGGAALAGTAALMYGRGKSAERKHPPLGRFADVDGVRVHYLVKGRGQPVVLLHGNGAMAQDWAISGVFDRLAEHHRVIAIDRPGCGYTERPRDRLWTASAQAEFLRRTLQALRVENPIVVGHSWGSIVAVAYGLAFPEAVGGLVLLSGYYFPTRRLDVWVAASPAIPLLGDAMRYTVSPVVGDLIAPRVMGKIFEPAPVPRRFAMRFPIGLSLRPWQLRASAEDSAFMVPAASAMQDRYGELEMPVAILTGGDDRIVTPARQSIRLHHAVPTSEITVIPGLGHMMHYGAQDEIVDAVARTADRMARPARRSEPLPTAEMVSA